MDHYAQELKDELVLNLLKSEINTKENAYNFCRFVLKVIFPPIILLLLFLPICPIILKIPANPCSTFQAV